MGAYGAPAVPQPAVYSTGAVGMPAYTIQGASTAYTQQPQTFTMNPVPIQMYPQQQAWAQGMPQAMPQGTTQTLQPAQMQQMQPTQPMPVMQQTELQSAPSMIAYPASAAPVATEPPAATALAATAPEVTAETPAGVVAEPSMKMTAKKPKKGSKKKK